jgi:hypothetical protein
MTLDKSGKKPKKAKGWGMYEHNDTYFNKRKFRDFLVDVAHVSLEANARERMLQHENAFFGLVAGPSVDSLDAAGKRLRNATLDDLFEMTVQKNGFAHIKHSFDCYFLRETLDREGVIIATARAGDYLGFISIRDPDKKKSMYSIEKTSRALQKPLFTTVYDDATVITGDTTVDVIPGRMHMHQTGTDFQSLRVVLNDTGEIVINMKGGARPDPSCPSILKARGVADDQTYRSDYVAGDVDWRSSRNKDHWYSIAAKVVGVKK